ncbi:MAG: hypothetical protein JSW46_04920 [Gemmatimonadota bacterium]|nr:MAG: hypothetical protein JSW46_04920 [Gemmatimonadota bacterium]
MLRIGFTLGASRAGVAALVVPLALAWASRSAVSQEIDVYPRRIGAEIARDEFTRDVAALRVRPGRNERRTPSANEFVLGPTARAKHVVQFRPARAGRVLIEANWSAPVSLRVDAIPPGKTGAYRSNESASPLRLEFDVTPEQAQRRDSWTVVVANRSGRDVSGRLSVAYPGGGRITLVSPAGGEERADADSAETGSGPANRPIDLLEGLQSDVNLERVELQSILGIRAEVYEDQDEEAGTFYFLPAAYYLRWDEDQGYGLQVLYRGIDTEGEARGMVHFSADLSARIGIRDIEAAEILLHAYLKRAGRSVREPALTPMPLDGSPRLALADNLTRIWDIDPDRVAVSAPSAVLDELTIEWVADDRVATDMQPKLLEGGVNGDILFDPSGDGLPAQSVPVEIALRDPNTYGRIEWQRGASWENNTPYGIVVKRLHALLLEKSDGTPRVVSWDLRDKPVPPGKRLRIRGAAAGVPDWLDELALLVWVEYVVDQDCARCDDQALASIMSGATRSERRFATISALDNLFADVGAVAIVISVGTDYSVPGGDAWHEWEVVLEGDGQAASVGPLYPPADAGSPFLYLVTLRMADGAEHRGNWVASPGLNLHIGLSQVEESLGRIPGRDL